MTFERAKYKDFALRQLKGRWGTVVGLTFIMALIVSLFSIPGFINSASQSISSTASYASPLEALEAISESSNSPGSTLISIIQSIIESILIMASLNVYLQMSRSPEKVSLSLFIEGLNNWWRATLCILLKMLFVFLWCLLLIIPGIIKAYSYSMMEYLLAEFHNLSVRDAMRISKIITKGYKWNIFVMELSFIGWGILAVLSFGIGLLWLRPYTQMSFVNAYHAMLKDALETGKIKPEELQ